MSPAHLPAGSTRESLVAPDILILQGLAAMVFALGFCLLNALLALPLHWLPGEVPRLIGLLWAVPATVVMTTRHATLELAVGKATGYLRQMWTARAAGLLLVLVVFPEALLHLQDHQRPWITSDNAPAIVAALCLCLVVDSLSSYLARTWYQLHQQNWEGTESNQEWRASPLYERSGRINRTQLLDELWRYWACGGIGMALALVCRQYFHGSQDFSFPWGLIAFVAYVVLGPVLLGRATLLRWRVQWQLDGIGNVDNVLNGWGRMAFAAALATLLLTGAVLGSGLFALAHRGASWAVSLVSLPAFPGASPAPSVPGSAHSATAPPGSAPLSPAGSDAGFGLHLNIGSVLPLLALLCLLGLIVWSVVWTRRQDSWVIARWRLLAALLLELAGFVRWCWQAPIRRTSQVASRSSDSSTGDADTPAEPAKRQTSAPLTPRQAILALYARSLSTADRRGYPRRATQTPHEHAVEVAAALASDQQTPTEIADLFVAARYGPHSSTVEQVNTMQGLWQSLRRALRRSPRR